ncbi:hypothetical protein KBB12_02670 [Candidatus Woesebacteria bacterium]|nr:hypothetical protein [Candidatus Woesebacteria bacterium]
MEHHEAMRNKINVIKLHTDPLTQAQLVVQLLREHSIRNIDLAKELEIKPSYLSHLIRVMKLPEMVIDGYWSKQLTFTHLILISRLKKQEDILKLYEEILQKSLNVSATEKRIREILYLIDSTGKYTSKDRLNATKSRIESSLGNDANVSIIQTRIKAKIVIEVPGNLATTSTFIELFANRFRKKKGQPPIETPQDGPELSLVGPNDQDGGGDARVENVVTDPIIDSMPQEEPSTPKISEEKYRFDPDF